MCTIQYTSTNSLYNQLLEQVLITGGEDPVTFQDLYNHPEKRSYFAACQTEINQLIKNNTWELVPRLKSIKVLKG
jgi:hypothetical protein